jgi:hypothetical protein
MADIHDIRVERLCDLVERHRATLDGTVKLPDADLVREAVGGVLNSRTGRMLRSTPKRDKRPIANVLHRLVTWHRSTGWLGTIFGVRWDCDNIVRTRSLDMSGPELYDALDTLALLITRGRSQAVDSWARALGR